jgi:class 3 adenylate cyclase
VAVSTRPETRYAPCGDVSIAYQVMGDGPIDLIFAPGLVSHQELVHELPAWSRIATRLASFARFISFDKRGSGLSDRVPGVPTLEERMDDLLAVMAAVGSERAVLLGVSEGGPMSALFAATYPERTVSLILHGSFARLPAAPDYPEGFAPKFLERALDGMNQSWGRGDSINLFAPSLASNPSAREFWARLERYGASPGAVRAMNLTNLRIDVRPILPAIRVPTLILHNRGDLAVPIAMGRYLARHIPGARFAEFDGDHALFSGDVDAVLAEIEEFVTGRRTAPLATERTLATVLFTDIVGSTERARELGDGRWRALLDTHDVHARRRLHDHRGRLIKTTGDGLLATFDGPARGIRCAAAIRDDVRSLGLDIRAGLHIGEVEVRGDDIGGIAVHIAARVQEKAAPGEVLVSRTITDLVAGSELTFAERGEHELRGVGGSWHLFAAAV